MDNFTGSGGFRGGVAAWDGMSSILRRQCCCGPTAPCRWAGIRDERYWSAPGELSKNALKRLDGAVQHPASAQIDLAASVISTGPLSAFRKFQGVARNVDLINGSSV